MHLNFLNLFLQTYDFCMKQIPYNEYLVNIVDPDYPVFQH